MVIKADKSRATCIFKDKKVNKMTEMELNNQSRYCSLKKYNIDARSIRDYKKFKEKN